MKKTKKTFSIVLVLLFFFFFGYGYLFVIVRDARLGMQEGRETLARALAEEESWSGRKNLVLETEGVREMLATYFIDENAVIEILSFLEQIGDNAQEFDVVSVNIIEQEEKVLRVSMRVGGAWEEVMRFVETLEVVPYAMLIDTVSFSSFGDLWSGSVIVSFSMDS